MTIKTRFPSIEPSLDLNFAATKRLDPRITFTRASSATFVNEDGLIETAGVNQARFDHAPTTGESLGLLVEEQRTNSVTNNTMVGAVAGTPGTLPTGWPFQVSNNGLAVSVVGTGTESGVTYLDWKISGTATAAAVGDVCFSRASALTAQTWTSSSYLRLVAGNLSGVTGATLSLIEETAATAFVTGALYSIALPTTASLITQRPAVSRTLTGGATVALLRTNLTFSVSSGSTVDFTLRIGLPQLEQGDFATSPILTSTAAATRSADVASITGSAFSGWYRQDEGTVFGSYIGVENVSGGTRRLVEIGTRGATSDRTILGYNATSNSRLLVIAGGATQADIAPAATQGTQISAAAAYRANDFQQGVNGSLGTADISGSVPPVVEMAIGGDFTGTANTFLNGTIRRLTYWPQRLTDSTLQTLTQ